VKLYILILSPRDSFMFILLYLLTQCFPCCCLHHSLLLVVLTVSDMQSPEICILNTCLPHVHLAGTWACQSGLSISIFSEQLKTDVCIILTQVIQGTRHVNGSISQFDLIQGRLFKWLIYFTDLQTLSGIHLKWLYLISDSVMNSRNIYFITFSIDIIFVHILWGAIW
jgi:hypothetical protein